MAWCSYLNGDKTQKLVASWRAVLDSGSREAFEDGIDLQVASAGHYREYARVETFASTERPVPLDCPSPLAGSNFPNCDGGVQWRLVYRCFVAMGEVSDCRVADNGVARPCHGGTVS